MESVKWIIKKLSHYKLSLFAVLILTVLYTALTVVHPVFLGKFVDAVLSSAGEKTYIEYALVLVGAILLKEISSYIKTILTESVSQDIILKVRIEVFKKLQSLDLKFFKSSKTGDLMSRLTMDAENIRLFVASVIPTCLTNILLLVFAFVVIFKVNPYLSIGLFATMPFVAYYTVLNARKMKRVFMKIRNVTSDLNSEVQENISGNRIVKAYAMEEFENNKFEEKNKAYFNSHIDFVNEWISAAPFITFWASVTNVVLVGLGGLMLIRGSLTVGEFTTVSGLVGTFISPLLSLGSVVNMTEQFNAGTLKIIELLGKESEVKNGNVRKRGTRLSGRVEFSNVTFMFGRERVLKHINFSVNPGQTVALIGPTGSGKSTVLNLLTRFYDPTYGSIYFDGVNAKNIDLKTLRNDIAYAMQDIFLFSDTIKNNIRFAVPDATDEDCIKAAKAAGAHEFITKLEDGYETVVGELGVGLSGGQRQRISLARALLKNPSIIILDDTTSALDFKTETMVRHTLDTEFGSKTTFIIAHKISSVKNADLIIVLSNGTMTEWGTHRELLAQNGYYKSIYDNQMGDFARPGNGYRPDTSLPEV